MNDDEVAELSKMAGTDFTGFCPHQPRLDDRDAPPGSTVYLAGHPEVELVYRRHPSEWEQPRAGTAGPKKRAPIST